MALTVLNVAFPLAPVGPSAVGGAEQVVGWLDSALVSGGHRSIVLAAEGSSVTGELWTVPGAGGRRLNARLQNGARALQSRRLRRLLGGRSIDVVHMHGIDFLSYLPAPGIPVLATLHLPLAWYPKEIFSLSRPGTYLNCVSRAQQLTAQPGASLLPAIENGVPTEALAGDYDKRDFVAALGRLCPEKGFHLALDAAKRAHIGLLLAGKLFRYGEHERYFAREIIPRLDHRRRFVGAIGPAAKRWLLGSARCLLVPSLTEETSSLVAMEALACGTPVIAFRAGALAEIVEHGKTGFLVSDVREMADAIAAAGRLDAGFCRETARRRFSLARMTNAYLALYARLANAGQPELPTAGAL